MQTTTNTPKRVFVTRKAIDIMNAKAFKVGDNIEATWESQRTRLVTDKRTGELKEVTDLLFKKDDGSTVAVPLDAGLRVALSQFNIQTGNFISLTKLDKIPYNGNMINQYEIMVAE